ncbi:MAG TPA: DUF1223 domain-containing protein [Casimicrobiaceae bacterium]|nr:DUF1223 domain-containing protein [Casimicrobiaceae bacterium]
MDAFRTLGIAFLGLSAATAAPAGSDPTCRVQSAERVLPLVELYTSEGCSSCPPADRWIGSNFTAGASPAASVLAFHVDYWDALGWPDRFARAEWSARQQAIARSGGSRIVYTPQVLLQGRDFGGWRTAGAMRAIADAATPPSRAAIVVEASGAGNRVRFAATARLRSPAERTGSRLLVAYTDSGHVTKVKGGENTGVALRHEHVVRALVTSGPADASGTLRLDSAFDLPSEPGAGARLVAFVERDAQRDILQSVSLPLEGCER